jgi:hypothetical protein
LSFPQVILFFKVAALGVVHQYGDQQSVQVEAVFHRSVLKFGLLPIPVLTFLTDFTDLQMRKRMSPVLIIMPVLTIGQYRPVLLFERQGLTKTSLVCLPH